MRELKILVSKTYLKKEIAEFIGDHEIKSIGVAHANVIEYVDKLKKVFNEAFHVNNYDINVSMMYLHILVKVRLAS